LDRDLVANEVTTWRDQRQLNPDLDFTAELETAIEESGKVICCVTPDVRRIDSFVRREIGYAIAVNKPIVPLIFEDTIPPISIVNVTREDFTHTPWERALRRLLDRLARGESYEQPERDPFTGYLSSLYRDIVATLRQLVFTEIDLRVDFSRSGLAQTDARAGALSSAFARGGLAGGISESPELNLTIREAFARAEDRLLLVGQAGAGKTVSMLSFARDAVARRMDDSSHALPMLAPIAAWPKTPEDQQHPEREPKRIFAWLASQIPALSEREIRDTILDGQALLMLDGLDELSSKYPLDLFLQQLPAQGQLLISSRASNKFPAFGNPLFKGVARLLPFDDQQLAAYVVGSAPLAASLRADPALRDLARIPLFLAILRYCFLQVGVSEELASNLERTAGEIRENIFDLYIHLRLEHELARQPVAGLFPEERLYDILGDIALEKASRHPDKYNFSNSDIWKPLEAALGSEDASLLVELCLALQIVVRDNQGVVQFAHQLLRRHFGRRTCLRVWNQQVIWPVNWWHFDRMQPAMDAMTKLAWFGDEREVGPLTEAALQNDHYPHAHAMIALAGIGHPAASSALCVLLSDKHRWERDTACCDVACWALIQIGEGALPSLQELRETTTSTHVLPLVLLILSHINCESSRALVESLVEDERAIDKSHTPGLSEGSELLGGDVKETTVGELARKVQKQLAVGAPPVYGGAFARSDSD
jgi:hypothetical protein